MNNLVLKQYVVDIFTHTVFKRNPAAVCLLENWLPDRLMQNIAQENNLPETAFLVRNGEQYELRRFTPGGEIDLCGLPPWEPPMYSGALPKQTVLLFHFRQKAGN